MQKLALYIKQFTDFIDKYGIPFHALSVLFWIWILNMNINNPEHKTTPVKISFYIAIVFIVMSSLSLIVSIMKKMKKD
ncbi:hypothetical protein EZL74_06100 [Flavobacterium silvisoli]|uniref:Uncharacterized protein n=1 Tax=Flavobacterium silvisoli TaxID=2529433 RepID=A0A4Q9Z1J3_9FLAO|nr:hypothetical protein [Flavobacterium silvisoli]TBX69986.1 hypothetical protein EZL74_06100 [Flavobacterium silvisoli]